MTAPVAGALKRSILHTVTDALGTTTIRLDAMAMGRLHGLDADAVDRLGLLVTEMAANIARHAGAGQIILRNVGEPGTGCIEILALDKGPGITDMTRIMRDGRTPPDGVPRDAGLAGIRRLADLFDIYSQPGRGTAVVTHVGSRGGSGPACDCSGSSSHASVGIVCLPLRGEDECGDSWAVAVSPGRLAVLVVDGLGHGPDAAVAAHAATAVFCEMTARPPEIILGAMHAALHPTRGAALSVAVIDQARRTVRFCGVGNVDGRVVTADANRHLIPQNGIVGHTTTRLHADDVPWPASARLVMHSDGISSRWHPADYPGLLARNPALLAGVLFRDFARPRDDATVLVMRDAIPPAAE